MELRIVVEEGTGRVLVHGPLANKVLCLGLLEIAKQSVLNWDPQEESPILLAPVGGFSQNGRNA